MRPFNRLRTTVAGQPLYDTPVNDAGWEPPATKTEAMEALAGHYAHYSIVAYIDQVPTGPMRTFIIS